MTAPDDLKARLESTAAASKPQTRGGGLRSPMALTLGAGLLVVQRLTMGLVLGRSTSNEGLAAPRPAAAVSGVASAPAISAELEMLRKEVEREEAPSRKLLALVPSGPDADRARAMLAEARRQIAAGGRRG